MSESSPLHSDDCKMPTYFQIEMTFSYIAAQCPLCKFDTGEIMGFLHTSEKCQSPFFKYIFLFTKIRNKTFPQPHVNPNICYHARKKN